MTGPDPGADFAELDHRNTPLGELILRRRAEPLLGGRQVYEVKLDDEFLMSSLFTAGETALAELALATQAGPPLDVVVGGLGLGYTARAVLASPGVGSLLVVELLGAIIEWHRRGLVPLSDELVADPRCRLVCGDFFALARARQEGFDPEAPGRRFHAVLVDIDHSPQHLLDGPRSTSFYELEGLRALATHLHPGGVFGLWSNDPPHEGFTRSLAAVFETCDAHVVSFANPYTGGESSSTVYVARTEGWP